MPLRSESFGAQPADVCLPGRMIPREIVQQALRILAIFVVTFACYLFISHFLLQTVKVVGTSMTPTLRHSQLYVLNRFTLFVRSPRLNDIVVLRDPADHGLSVKRVVASPGDTVLLRGGKVFVNGVLLEEPYLAKGTPTYPAPHLREQSFTCADNQYVVLGDNRMNSADSRTYGPIHRSDILGLLMH